MIATRKIMWAEKPMMLLQDATLYNSARGIARKGDLFIYKDMVIFCSTGEEIKRPMEKDECCFIYAAGYSDCFAQNGVYVLDQAQQTVGLNLAARKRADMLTTCEAATLAA